MFLYLKYIYIFFFIYIFVSNGINVAYYDAILSLVLLVAHYSFGVAETVGTLVAGKVYRILVVRNVIPVDADISVFDDSYMDPAKAEDYAEVHLVAADYNLAVECALHLVEKAIMVVDCQMKEHANVVRRPEILQKSTATNKYKCSSIKNSLYVLLLPLEYPHGLR